MRQGLHELGWEWKRAQVVAKDEAPDRVTKLARIRVAFEQLCAGVALPRANPIERAFGDVHDTCTRNHSRNRIWHLVQDVPQHLRVNGPWRQGLSEI